MSEESLALNTAVLVSVSDTTIDVNDMMDFVADPASGATVLFSGTVRDHSPGRDGVSRLDYEAYGAVVEDKIREIVFEAIERWPVLRVAAVHRTGTLAIGEAAVMVAVSSPHRVDAFPAARYVIDELKGRAPIWKKEHWSGGAEWVEEGDS
ncbi:MAG: molybdenum cofactor biosynthesis protein MoaE [Acidimicrobiia bacterium]